jgi:hypothetical protein
MNDWCRTKSQIPICILLFFLYRDKKRFTVVSLSCSTTHLRSSLGTHFTRNYSSDGAFQINYQSAVGALPRERISLVWLVVHFFQKTRLATFGARCIIDWPHKYARRTALHFRDLHSAPTTPMRWEGERASALFQLLAPRHILKYNPRSRKKRVKNAASSGIYGPFKLKRRRAAESSAPDSYSTCPRLAHKTKAKFNFVLCRRGFVCAS